MVPVYIALGSNLGNREANLRQSLELLGNSERIHVVKASSFHDTIPVGGPSGQGKYLNAAAELNTDLTPQELMDVLLGIEARLGRVRSERNAPRTIDLDLLLYDTAIINTPNLTVPHPRMQDRRFVLAPLAEIAPGVSHPVLHRTIGQLLAALDEVSQTNTKELSGLRAVVTGSTSGIGRAMVEELSRAGAKVIIHGHRSNQTAENVAAKVRENGQDVHVFMANLSHPEECQRLVDLAWNYWGGVDIWVNNAGADTLTGDAASWSFERKWQELCAVDVTATMIMSRLVGSRMKASRERACSRPVIVNVGWDQAETGMEGESGQLFAAAKGAVMAFTKSLALTLAPDVRVNCLAPGWIRTAWGAAASERWQERVLRETPLGRWGSPEDVAQALRWLVSTAAGFITGQTIRVNGGTVR